MRTLPELTLLSLALAAAAACVDGCGSSEDVGSDQGGAGGESVDAGGSGGEAGTGTDGGKAGAGGSGGAAGSPGEQPPIISKSSLSALEAETHVAAAPNGFVAVAYIAVPASNLTGNGYRFSKDDGATWEPAAVLNSPGGQIASDPVLAIDSANNFYMTWIGFVTDSQGNPTQMHVYASQAPAGTTTFGAPVEVSQYASGDQFDKPWITVMPDDTVVVVYAKTSSGGIYAARSTDHGQTWSNAVIVEDGNFRNLSYPCHPSTGSRLYATYSAGGGIGLRWSDDGGATWPTANKTAVAAQGEQVAFDDPTCVAEGDEVWVAYGLTADGFSQGMSTMQKLGAIRLGHSSDGGTTIDAHYDAHDAAAATYFMHPYLGREDSGALDLVYYAGNADGDTAGSFRRSRSTDGGKTFGASVSVKTPITFHQSRTDAQWLGDYAGLWIKAGELYTSFTDNSQAYAHVAFFATKSP